MFRVAPRSCGFLAGENAAKLLKRHMELHQIHYFVALSRSLNFTRAAERCNITQPALIKAIQRLEGELGGELIYWERQFTKLTALGKLVLPRLEQILAA